MRFPSVTWGKLKNIIWRKFDPEVMAMRRIIVGIPRERMAVGTYTPLMRECDKIFLDRLEQRPRALKLNYWENHFALESFAEFPEIRGHVLDFGCGSGHLDYWLAHRGMTITGVDASPVAIGMADFNRRQARAEIAKRLHFLELDVRLPNVAELKFDSVWSNEVFEHIADPQEVVRGLRQYAVPGAFFLVCVPWRSAYDNPGHVNHYQDEQELSAFLEPYVSVVRILVDTRHEVMRALCRF